jgi:hypothetical protein
LRHAAIRPSRILTPRTIERFHSSFATKKFRSISTGAWDDSSFGRSVFSFTVSVLTVAPRFKDGGRGEADPVAIALEEPGNSEPLRMIASEPGMDAVNLLEPVDEPGGR